MRRNIRLIVILLTLSLAGSAHAYETWTHYFNCSMAVVGGSLRECDNDYTWWQQQSGAFKAVERYYCDPIVAESVTWYAWNGSSWIELDGEPEPSC